MFRRIIQISSFFVIFSLVFALPISSLAQETTEPAPAPVEPAPVVAPVEVIQPAPIVEPVPATAGMGGDLPAGDAAPGSGGMGGVNPVPMVQPLNNFMPGPTCNINGTEMPGSCGDRQQMFGPNMGPSGEGNNMRMGPSEEEQEKMEAKREEMEKKQRQKGLQQMQRGVKSMVKSLTTIESRIAKLEKQNITVPAELKERVLAAKTAAEAVMKATDPEEVMDQMEALQEMGNSMPDTMRKLEMLARLPQMIKQAEKEITRLDRAYKSMSTKATRAKFMATTVLDKWLAVITELKTALADIKANGINEEEPMEALNDAIFSRMEEAWQYNQTMDMLLNAKRNLKQVATALKKYERTITALKRKKQDTAEAETLLAEMKTKYQAVEQIVAGGLAPEEIEEALGEMESYVDMQDQMEELLNLNGQSLFEQQMKGPTSSDMKMPQLNMPNFEKLMLEAKNLNSTIAQNWAKEEAELLAVSQAQKTAKLKELATTLKEAKTQIIELTAAGVVLPDDLKEGVLNTLAALGLPTAAVAQR